MCNLCAFSRNRHKFDERVKKGEEVSTSLAVANPNSRHTPSCWQVLYFCFDFLKHIVSDEFSIVSSPADHIGQVIFVCVTHTIGNTSIFAEIH